MCRSTLTWRAECVQRPGRGFTLVELLVVIAIIVLLIAILLPSLGRAKKKAQQVACAANLRMLGIAFLSFAEEHDGYLPDDEHCTYTGNDAWKNDWLAGDTPRSSFTGGNTSGLQYVPEKGTIYPYVSRDKKAFRCPSLPFNALNSGVGSNGRFDYTFPDLFTGARLRLVPIRTTVTSGSQTEMIATFMLAEESPEKYANNQWFDGAWCASDETTVNHLGGTNIASTDGSCVWYNRKNVPLKASECSVTAPSGRTVSYSVYDKPWGWFNSQ